MPEIKNNFLKGKMNQDMDSRILPQGEYREAINLLISRSEGATVGEFENILGNTAYALDAAAAHIIGHVVDETNDIVYLFATTFYNISSSSRAASTDTCLILRVDLNSFNVTKLVTGYWLNFNKAFPIHAVNLVEDLLFWTDNFNQPRRINILTAQQADAYTLESQIAVAQYYPYEALIPLERTTAITDTCTTTQIVTKTSCPNVRIGDIVTTHNKTQALADNPINNDVPPVKVTEIVSTEAPFNTFNISPATTTQTPPVATLVPAGTKIDFSRTTMENHSDINLSNYSTQTVDALHGGGANIVIEEPSFGGVPRVGDIIKLVSTSSGTTLPYYTLRVGSINITPYSGTNQWRITFEKSMTGDTTPTSGVAATGFQVGDVIEIATNDLYNASFPGDSKFLKDRFVRFSYRFRFENNEYSLMAPFSQIMFIPKQYGQFGLGQLSNADDTSPDYYDDEVAAYQSTIVEWFENDIDTIGLKIPLPSSVLTELNTTYNIQDIDILYKESDGQSVKVLDTLIVADLTDSEVSSISYNDDINGLIDKKYIDYSYKSNKPYKTLPERQTTRVYDRVPIKALGQELISNRVVYGNFVEKQTPPSTIPYKTSFAPRDARFSDYATEYPYHSVKQNRTYQVGFVLADYYGRQSDVILSSYDNSLSSEGSSIYVPYRNAGDASDVPVFDWIGQMLTLTVDSAIGTEEGENLPGLYREEDWVKTSTLNDPGTGFEVDRTYAATSMPTGASGVTVRVTAITGGGTTGPIDTYTIMTAGSGWSPNDFIFIEPDSGDEAEIEVESVGDANPLGWYTYKVVVKQQEQEYYNVYFPGFVNGLPINNLVWNKVPRQVVGTINPGTTPIETQRNSIFFTSLLSENVNKIPRDLKEIGPTDREYNSSEELYIRINNPNATSTGGVRNLQYYPGKLAQETLNIATARETQLAPIPFVPFSVGPDPSDTVTCTTVQFSQDTFAYGTSHPAGDQGEYTDTVNFVAAPRLNSSGDCIGDMAVVSRGSIPWGDVGEKASFYGADQNPFILKCSQTQNKTNPIGAIVCGNTMVGGIQHDTNFVDGVRIMEPTFSSGETKPVYSLLDIFWETTMTGKLEELNSAINTNYNGIVAVTDNEGTFDESITVDGQAGDLFYFLNGSGGQINSFTNLTPSITKVVRQSAPATALTPISDYFDIAQTSTGGQYKIRSKKKHWFSNTSASAGTDVYIISLATTWISGGETYNDTLENAITLSLTNIAPSIWSNADRDETNFTVAMDSSSGSQVIQVYGKNGSVDTAVVDGTRNDYKQLSWEMAGAFSTPHRPSTTFTIDSTTGIITVSGLVDETTYSITAKVTDADGDVGALSTEQLITVNAGTPFAPKAIMRAQTGTVYLAGYGNSGEWIWGDVTDAYSPSANTLSLNPSLIYNAQKAYDIAYDPACKAWLFQGTIELQVLFESQAGSPAGDGSITFLIQRRTFTPPNTNNSNSRGSWETLDSVVETGFDTMLATDSAVAMALTVGAAADSITKRYKFDQLGEYRIITSALSGDQASYCKMSVSFKDGNCRNNSAAGYCTYTNGPCNPS